MASGGARSVSGPPPDPMALRRGRPDDQASWTTLPAARAGEPPAWPLLEASEREAHHWRALWRLPQAVMWEQLGQQHEVALFIGALVEVETGGAPVATQRLVRSYLDSLGLSVQGMLRNRWRIASRPTLAAADGEAQSATTPPARTRRRPSTKSRFKVVPHGEAGS